MVGVPRASFHRGAAKHDSAVSRTTRTRQPGIFPELPNLARRPAGCDRVVGELSPPPNTGHACADARGIDIAPLVSAQYGVAVPGSGRGAVPEIGSWIY